MDELMQIASCAGWPDRWPGDRNSNMDELMQIARRHRRVAWCDPCGNVIWLVSCKTQDYFAVRF